MEIFKARVVHLCICDDLDCQIVAGSHLVVHTEYLEVVRGNATAISYTWGAYSREQEAIGHDIEGCRVKMELGKEWKIEDLVKTLDGICSDNEFCWIDQLCIKQADKTEVRETLAKIPDIYRSFDVVVLLPGSPCSCSSELPDTPRELQPTVYCPNNLTYGSWFSRLWTRQELVYARNFRVKWTSPGQVECIRQPAWRLAFDPLYQVSSDRLDDLVFKLSLNARLEWREQLASVTNPAQTSLLSIGTVRHLWQRMLLAAMHDLVAAAVSLSLWKTIHANGYGSLKRDFALLRPFILGLTFTSDMPDGDAYDEDARVHRFLNMLLATSEHERKATQLRDYVVAVWVDCPGYKLPEDYREMKLGNLLENAVRQLERLHAISYATTMPAGILNLTEAFKPTVVWRPSLYLDSVDVKTTLDVYGVIHAVKGAFVTEDGLAPLRFFRPPAPVITLYDFEILFQDSSSKDTMEFIVRAAKGWSTGTWLNFAEHFVSKISMGNEDLMSFVLHLMDQNAGSKTYAESSREWPDYMRRTVREPSTFSTNEQGERVWSPSEDLDHTDIVYRIVSNCLSLNVQTARNLGLRVMVDLGDEGLPPRLGMSQSNFGLGRLGPTYTVRSGCSHDAGGGQDLLLEVASRSDLSLRVLGVWIPCEDYPEKALMGEICPHDAEELIG